ncbi:MAG: phosphoenolpyruvate--protein phosphotransferase [Acidobacteria bacterium 21-70-11]|nr:MAG: phosphoenolpyruvate--protein phosphotransferase [Acidobacteria bacterium 21-70-11]HQU33806.1 phosphoenolpyruvate--protein phosphotransferase [Thermoanaerobaculaceae bacterium]
MAKELSFRFPLPHGLHARPASLLRDAAGSFQSAITLTNRRNDLEANAKSTLALVATLTRQGDECTLLIAGGDEPAAAEALRRFISVELPLCDDAPPAVPAAQGSSPLPRALRGEGVRVHRGVAASGGIGRAPALLAARWKGGPDLANREKGSPEAEFAKLEWAFVEAGAALRARRAAAANNTERAVLNAHLAILEDVELKAKIADQIHGNRAGAGQAVAAVVEHFAAVLRDSGSAVLAERALDLCDVEQLLIRALDPGTARDDRIALERDAVVVAQTLSPAQFIALDTTRLKGLVLARGGATSHTVILARARGVPCVTGVGEAVRTLRDGQEVVVDGERGLLVADPSGAVSEFYDAENDALRTLRERAERTAARDAATSDGRRIEVAANVSSLAEVQDALAAGAEGVGLFRTELLFMDRAEAPSEDEQAEVFAAAARLAGARSVIIRTLDIGGDKPIPYLDLPEERNPFLGFRAIRTYAENPDIVAAQIRACLRASAFGNVKIMFPMVSSLDDVRTLRGLVAAQMESLVAAGVPFDRDIGVGVMVEVPSLAFVMDQVAREVDFCSIGSNDLLQYLLAVDRDNQRVAHLYKPFEPAFLRALAAVCDGAHACGRWVGLCGELGGNPLAVPLLVGLGLDEISVGSARVSAVKSAIAGCATPKCRQLLESAMRQETAADVEALLRAFAATRAERSLLDEDLVRLRSSRRTKDEAIRELVGLLRTAGRVGDPDLVEDAIWQREEAYSTGVGFSVAIPHCKADGVLATSIAVASYPGGVEWGSLDGSPVTMAILIAVRASDPGETHLRTIAALSRKLMDDAFRASLLAAASAAEVVALLRSAVEAS